MKYKICNVGCDDVTEAIFSFTEEEFSFLKGVFEGLNEYSTYGCMPKIYIEETEEQPTEPPIQKIAKVKREKITYDLGKKCATCGKPLPDIANESMCSKCLFADVASYYREAWKAVLNEQQSKFLNKSETRKDEK